MRDVEHFGTTRDGQDVRRVSLAAGGLSARIITLGAALQDLRLDGHAPPLVLGFDKLADYEAHSPHFGATAGRYANRIANGRFALDGVTHQLDRNENDTHHLHGGRAGFGRRVWSVAALSDQHVRLERDSADGEMGYPGACHVATTYRLEAGGRLAITHEATALTPTICNLTHHSYFNLDGGDDILDHELMIGADHVLPVDAGGIPVGTPLPVEGTAFDFRDMRPIRLSDSGRQFPYDHNYCLAEARMPKRSVALVRSPYSGIHMEMRTGEPGVQFYAAGGLDTPVPGLSGKHYRPYSGFCLEAQIWPDAPNWPDFPSAVLRPGERLLQETDYIFTRS
jgi:aldose 1-epimerase